MVYVENHRTTLLTGFSLIFVQDTKYNTSDHEDPGLGVFPL